MILRKIYNITLINISRLIFNIQNIFYRIKNKNKDKIFVFTDSRGYEVTHPWNKKNPFSSYIGCLIKDYNVEYHICEESSTTIIDFLYLYNKRIAAGHKYQHVIAHIGLVDFSPRPLNMLDKIINKKQDKIKALGLDISVFQNRKKEKISTELYFGDHLGNLYSMEFFKKEILTKLQSIDNMIYIGCNKVLQDWNGNYWRNRPKDINILLDYNNVIEHSLHEKNKISIINWTEADIKENTVDNIHLNKNGFNIIANKLKSKIGKSCE